MDESTTNLEQALSMSEKDLYRHIGEKGVVPLGGSRYGSARIAFVFLTILVVAACSGAEVAPSAAPTIAPSAAPTVAPTPVATLTATAVPTAALGNCLDPEIFEMVTGNTDWTTIPQAQKSAVADALEAAAAALTVKLTTRFQTTLDGFVKGLRDGTQRGQGELYAFILGGYVPIIPCKGG